MDYEVGPYRTPPGYLDFPYVYVFDGRGLTDGLDYNDIAVPMQGDSDFVMRRITGIRTLIGPTGQWRYRNASGGYESSAFMFAGANSRTVLPEKLYPYNAAIRFDLANVTRQSVVCTPDTIYTSFLAFQGVKRFVEGHGYPTGRTAYQWRPYKWAYPVELTLSAFAGDAPVRFTQFLDNYDFELHRISIAYQDGTTVATPDFGLMLYDPNSHQFSNLPLNVDFVNNAFARFPSQKSIFPVPGVLYPAGSQIKFDLTSYLCAAGGPQSYEILFDGVQRLPC